MIYSIIYLIFIDLMKYSALGIQNDAKLLIRYLKYKTPYVMI